jgi:hypothetical protein
MCPAALFASLIGRVLPSLQEGSAMMTSGDTDTGGLARMGARRLWAGGIAIACNATDRREPADVTS